MIQDNCLNAATWSFPITHKMRQEEGAAILTTHTNLCIVIFLKIQILNLHEHCLSIYSIRGLKMKRHNSKTRLFKIGAKTSHMRSVTCFPTLAPPKTTLDLLFMSHGRCDLILYISTPYFTSIPSFKKY